MTEAPSFGGLPAPGAEAAALVIQTALDGGQLRGVELLAAARALSSGQSIATPSSPAWSSSERNGARDN